MFCLHKLIVLGKADKGLSLGIKQHFSKYASAYLELISVVADLQLYVLHLEEPQRKEILETLAKRESSTPIRKAKAEITINKFEYMFRNKQFDNIEDLMAKVNSLTAQYFEFVQLDEKPEKGERKMADEQVLLIAEMIESYLSKESSKDLQLFKICLLEIAYEYSNYNFDIQLQLIKTFDSMGLSASFSEAYDQLNIKGVQLESLGYISARNSLNWMNFTLQSNVQVKFSKYLKNNAKDLADMKVKALNDNNYSALENFIEYEKYLGNSYFTQFIFEYLERGKGLLTNFIQGTEPALNVYSKGLSVEQSQVKLYEFDLVKINRTQDNK